MENNKDINKDIKIEFKHADNFGLSFAFGCGFYQVGNICWSGSNEDVFIKGEYLDDFTAQLTTEVEGDLLDPKRWSFYNEAEDKEYTLEEMYDKYGK